jgi:ParB/RepB/Spo0J family partition protein
MNIENIRHERLHPAPDNPNRMEESTLTALKRDIAQNGFVQPVLVRPLPDTEGHYEIIDGEHRWKALGDLGLAKVPCVVDGNADATDASARRVTMNRIRGEFVPVRLAHLLADLSRRVPMGEIRQRLDMDQKELRNYLALNEYLIEAEGGEPEDRPKGSPKSEPKPKSEPDKREVLIFVCTNDQSDRIALLFDVMTGHDKDQQGTVAAKQARAYLKEIKA